MDCLFCKITNKQISSEFIVYEDSVAAAFLDIHPLTSGHTLVVPRRHYENIITCPERDAAALFLVVKKVTAILQKSLRPHGFTIGINHGRDAGQAIDHLHIHVIPRFPNDGGKSIHSLVSAPPLEPLLDTIKKIRLITNSEQSRK